MALTSPGVEVTIIDQSQYLPAPGGSVPLVILATAQNKADGSGTGVAAATTATNAGKLFQVTSQRDLVNLYGSPFFYSTTNGTPIQGYELNEYGLLAAYSLLGVTNRCYVLRADIDLASLVGQTGRPTGFVDNGTYWEDTTASTWGIYQFNAVTGKFTLQNPIVITNPDDLNGRIPLSSIGSIGDYAVNTLYQSAAPASSAAAMYFYKTTSNSWARLGSGAWKGDIPTVTSVTPTSLTGGQSFDINVNGLYSTTISIPLSPNNTIAGIASEINNLGWSSLIARVRSGKLCVISKQPGSDAKYIKFSSSSGTALLDLGIPADVNLYQANFTYGTSAEMPLWTSSQAEPRPTGSVWLKVGAAGNGLQPVVSKFNSTTQLWVNKNVSLYTSDWIANAELDGSGGQSISVGTVYAQYDFNHELSIAPINMFERLATGPTVITGTTIPTSLAGGQIAVQTSVPGSTALTSVLNVNVPGGADAAAFVTAWSAANILYTAASVTTDGAIQLTHTEGGVILLDDTVNGVSTGLVVAAGFVVGTTTGCKYGPGTSTTFFNAPAVTVTGVGTLAQVYVNSAYNIYQLVGNGVGGVAGSGYAVGDTLRVLGSSIGGVDSINDLVVEVTAVDISTGISALTPVSGSPTAVYKTQLSNWVTFEYIANEGTPVADPVNNKNWFYSVTDEVDIMVQKGGAWIGYGKTNYDSTGFPTTGVNATDPAGPIIAASAPTVQNDGSTLVYGDLWIDTSDLENYPVISRWESVGDPGSQVDQWVLLDNSDQTSSTGVLFADARWATSGTISPTQDPMATIASLLQSDYLDLDAPQATLYPQGMLLFNARRSGYNVKQYRTAYFNSTDFPGETLPVEKAAWVTSSGNQSNGAPYMGRKAQRAMVVEAMNAIVSTNTEIRDEDNFFNLMAAPNYPELQPGMVTLNNDRGMTGYIIGDTPLRLAASATDIQAWATNAAGATGTGEAGCVTRDTYLGLFYPSGITSDLSGNLVAVPSSHMMLRTFLRNDSVAYPWLAAAGTRRGIIDNASNIGYLDAATGEFQTIKTSLGLRDVLYTNFINPMVFFTGVGLLNYGNKTSFNSSSALDRTNVARLVAYIRRQLTLAARPFVFEPNDAVTRNQIGGVVQTLMADLVAKRGLYDYLVVCDESNNTPARIDRNELWIDVAVEPVKAAEFIYIPVRILNTGELSA